MARRRITVSSLAPKSTEPMVRSYTGLGDTYSTLSIKVPQSMATDLAVFAAAEGMSVSEAVRTCIQNTLDATREETPHE